MPQAKKAAGNGKATRRSAATAVAELSGEPITGEFRGVAITLPAKMPATFTLDLAEVQGKKNDLGPAYRLLVSILGEEQWHLLRDKVAQDEADSDDVDGEEFSEVLGEMLSAVIGAYNMEPGESPASGTS